MQKKLHPKKKSALRTALSTALIAVALVALGFTLLEGILRWRDVKPLTDTQDPFVGFSGYFPLFVELQQENGDTNFVTATNKTRYFNTQRFPTEKRKDTYRIVCMGGSTTFGRPYNDATSFSGWLREMLPIIDPSHPWEVINAGGISYATYRVAKLMEEMATYEPDLFLIYTGHNEFLEKRTYGPLQESPTWMQALRAAAMKTRTFAVVHRLRNAQLQPTQSIPEGGTLLPAEVKAILDESVGLQSYHRDDQHRASVLAHTQSNLRRMITIARDAGADIMLITPASNLKDCMPFKSEHPPTFTEDNRRAFNALMAQADQAHNAARFDDALAAYDKALDIDNRYAHLHYQRAHTLAALNRNEEARHAFVRARDEDICPLRAPTTIVEMIREIAQQHNIPLIDFEKTIATNAMPQVPGADAFIDHVHPTIEGHRQLAFQILAKMQDRAIVKPAPTWDTRAQDAVKSAVEATIDTQAHSRALRTISKVYGWTGKFEEAHTIALRATSIDPTNPDAWYDAALSAIASHRNEEAVQHFEHAIALNPQYDRAHNDLGNLRSALGQTDRARESFRRALKLKPDSAPYHNNLANELVAQGNRDEGIKHYRHALEANPNHAITLGNLGLALLDRGDYAEAVQHLQSAVNLQPDAPEARYNLGLALLKSNDFQAAIKQFQHVTIKMKNYAPLQYHLGDALARVGRRDEAIAHLNEALRLQPTYQAARRALAELQSPKQNQP